MPEKMAKMEEIRLEMAEVIPVMLVVVLTLFLNELRCNGTERR